MEPYSAVDIKRERKRNFSNKEDLVGKMLSLEAIFERMMLVLLKISDLVDQHIAALNVKLANLDSRINNLRKKALGIKTEKFLSHSMIAGREGNLKRTDISIITRHKIESELKSIQKILKYNTLILEKAVTTLKPELILKLKGWPDENMKKATERLKDREFSWANNVEKLVPTAGGYEHERIESSEVKSIIQKIISRRKS